MPSLDQCLLKVQQTGQRERGLRRSQSTGTVHGPNQAAGSVKDKSFLSTQSQKTDDLLASQCQAQGQCERLLVSQVSSDGQESLDATPARIQSQTAADDQEASLHGPQDVSLLGLSMRRQVRSKSQDFGKSSSSGKNLETHRKDLLCSQHYHVIESDNFGHVKGESQLVHSHNLNFQAFDQVKSNGQELGNAQET